MSDSRIPELNWDLQRKELRPDGSLRDIYVLETALDDWKKVLEFIVRGPFEARLDQHGQRLDPRNADVEELFERGGALLNFEVGGVDLACHFFAVQEIEFDFVPNDVGEAELRALLAFIADIGDLTGKTVVMTPENLQDAPFFRYDPAERRMAWIPPS